MLYTAIIGDIKGSKKLNNRKEVQRKLSKILGEINSKYESDIASTFSITLGDEFQGLLRSPRYTLEIVKYIQTKMYPVIFRIGIGLGDISTDINPGSALGADGPAYYAAREMVDVLHETENKNKSAEADIRLSIYNEYSFEIEQINTMLALIKVIEDRWKPEQRLTIWDMIENGGSQQECAVRMKTTQSTVGRRLISGNYYLYYRSLHILGRAIELLEGEKELTSKFLLILGIGHVLGDFYFQTDKMAQQKDKSWKGIVKHAIEYAASVLLIFLLFINMNLMKWILLYSASHLIIDAVKYKLLRTGKIKKSAKLFIIDQCAHNDLSCCFS